MSRSLRYLKPIVVLSVICILVAALLASVDLLTGDKIDDNTKQARLASLAGMIDGADYEELTLTDAVPETVTGVFLDKNGGGVAVTVATASSYSKGDMEYAIAFTGDGVVCAVNRIAYYESKDFGDYGNVYINVHGPSIGDVELYGGATYSSTALRSAFVDAYTAVCLLTDTGTAARTCGMSFRVTKGGVRA